MKEKQKKQDVIFVLSTIKALLPVTKLKQNHPQALFLTTEDNFVDLFTEFLPKLKKVEGLSINEFMAKALNNESEFSYEEGDND